MAAAAGQVLEDGFWEPKRALTLTAARQHTRFIRVLRMALLGVAALLIGLLAYFIIDRPEMNAGTQAVGGESVRMTNPRYTGLDGQGLPFNLTADYAIRDLVNMSAVKLVNPVLSFSQGSDGEIKAGSRIVAQGGSYDSAAQTMELTTDVVVRTTDGNICRTSHALINARAKTVTGNQPIECEGNFGTMRGDQYEILDDYSRFVFINNFTALLLPESGNYSADPTPTPLED